MSVIPGEGTTDRSLHRLVAEDSPDLHTVTTVEGVYRFVSPASYALFGWEPVDLIGRNQDSFVHPDDIALVERARRAAFKDPNGAVTSVSRFRCAGGAYRWTEALSRLVDDNNGRQLALEDVQTVANDVFSRPELLAVVGP